ncbi:MAG: hypothetical protein AAF645_06340 [Myxococcota bacterium]
MLRVASAIVLLLGPIAAAHSVHAQAREGPPSEPPDGPPPSVFDLGISLYEQGRFDEAYAAFQGGYELTARPEFIYNMFLCRRDAGMLEEAAELLERFLAEAGEINNRSLLEGRLVALRERLATRAAEQEERDAAEAARAEAEANARAARERAIEPPSRVGPAVLLAVGGASIVAGATLAVLAAQKNSDLSDRCFDGRCVASDRDDIDQLRTRAIAADVTLFGGVALVGAGALWWILTTPDEDDLAVQCGPLSCSVLGN